MKRFIIPIIVLIGCSSPSSDQVGLKKNVEQLEGRSGNVDYLTSPFVTAGDRVYMVGHQNGSFPDLGWHVTGEMGGIWNHPIKLMDGIAANLSSQDGLNWCLNDAKEFVNYAMANKHIYEQGDLEVEQFQFVPEGVEGIVLQFSIKNNGSESRSMDFSVNSMIDLMPVWISERIGWEDGTDERIETSLSNTWAAKDANNPWFVVFGSDKTLEESESLCAIDRRGKGFDLGLTTSLEIESNGKEIVTFYVSGSASSLQEAENSFEKLKTASSSLLDQKIAKYASIADRVKLELPDEGQSKMMEWIKYNTQWLVRDVPGVGRGVSAGIPDYPWWFGTDGAYIIQGLASAGFHEEAMNTIDLVIDFSKKANKDSGKIMHESSTNGVVFNPGNLNTTPTFIHALWKAYTWTGNEGLLKYYEHVINGINWIESQDENMNGYPDGAGMMEIHGLDGEMIDVVAYMYQAYLAAANFAEVMDDTELATSYRGKAADLKEKINSEWWVKDAASFADFRSNEEKFMESLLATKARMDTLPGISQEIRRSMIEEVNLRIAQMKGRKHSEEIGPKVIHHNWVVNTPMEVGAASEENAEIALETGRNYTSRFGMYVTGIDKKEETKEATKWKAFSYVSAVMTLPTGVQAIGEARYGNTDRSLEYLKMLENSFGYALPGSMYEVSPDFGMIVQGWNIYAVAVPIVDYFFGIQPEAHKKRITVMPNPPSSWPSGSLKNVPVGDNLISVSFERDGDKINYTIEQELDWEITFVGKDGKEQVVKGAANTFVD